MSMSDFDFPGRGGRKPQVNVPLELIYLDILNPRLARQQSFVDELDIIRTLYEEYDIDDLASSMSTNGYFDEEPIIVVPRTLPDGFTIDETKSADEIQDEIRNLIRENAITFTVVEGNRRITTAKILESIELRESLNIRPGTISIPTDQRIIDDLKRIPAIVYTDRRRVSPYLGVRHITGLLKWDAFAKAAYIAQNIDDGVNNDGLTFEQSINRLKQHIPDRTDGIRKQYLNYRVLTEAQTRISFDTDIIKEKFSLLTLALGSPAIRDYVGWPTYKTAIFELPIVQEDKLDEFKDVLQWIYGDGNDIQPVLSDSRQISSRLAPVLSSPTATQYLKDFKDLDEAYLRSDGEKNYVIKKLYIARNNIDFAQRYTIYRDDSHFNETIINCDNAIQELKALFGL